MKKLEKTIIISGEICSGKSTLAQAISSKTRVAVASFGDFIKGYCIANKIEPTRKNLQDVGESFIQEDSSAFLSRVIAHSKKGPNSLIFEGVRHKAILDEIASVSKILRTIYIDTNEVIRHVRYKEKHKEDLSLEEFRAKCNHPVELEIKLLKDSAELILDGTLTIDEMLDLLEKDGILKNA